MREVKFRGKRLDNGEWVYGAYIPADESHLKDCIYDCTTDDFIEVDGETVGQYIGVKDRNGTEIYEGDIVKRPTRKPDGRPNGSVRIVVSWITGRVTNGWNICSVSCEVIGNIHEDPELLEARA